MQLRRKLSVAVIALAAPLALAGPPNLAKAKAEVFYRSFDSTSFIALDAAALARAYDRHLSLTGPRELQALLAALPSQCISVTPEHARDLRLLIRWSAASTWTWQASQFAYRDGRTGATCQFSRTQQDTLLASLGLKR